MNNVRWIRSGVFTVCSLLLISLPSWGAWEGNAKMQTQITARGMKHAVKSFQVVNVSIAPITKNKTLYAKLTLILQKLLT